MDNINNFEILLNYFKLKKYEFVNDKLKKDINNAVKLLFPNLNFKDVNVLYLFSIDIIEKISLYFDFDKNNQDYYFQWSHNNYRDIKGVILLLLPFIDDKNNGKLLNEMIDLNQFLYAKLKNNIPNLSNENRTNLLNTDFKFSNMSLGLIDENCMLNLYEDDNIMKLIYTIIHHNYLSLLKTLEIMNGKYYVNWVNITPIIDYKKSNIYKKTKEGLIKFKNIFETTLIM